VSPKIMDDAALLERTAATAQALGVTRLRTACLGGRRYEEFQDRKTWETFIGHWREAAPRAEAALRRHKLALAIENHKDWLTDELAALLRKIGSPHVGACVDFGNNLAFLEDPLATAEALAPFAVTTHGKDHLVARRDSGFDLADVALGDGVLPLPRIVKALRAKRPDAPLCLETMTRDPLEIPYREARYWSTMDRDPAKVSRFEAAFLKRPASRPLPRISALGNEAALAAEDENIRRGLAYARKALVV
jgi:sugar phosphate isomerase/epimerase